MMLTQTSQLEYEELCRMDVLGLADQRAVYGEFKEQLVRSGEGWYETGLPWKGRSFKLAQQCERKSAATTYTYTQIRPIRTEGRI